MEPILKHIFNKTTLQEIPVETLQQFTSQYPFFALGHFWLAKKLKEDNDDRFEERFQKTALYFHNPLWLLSRLQQGDTSSLAEKSPEPVTAYPAEETASETDFSSHDLIENVFLHQETTYGTPEEILSNQTKATEREQASLRPEGINNEDESRVGANGREAHQAVNTTVDEESSGIETLENDELTGENRNPEDKPVFQAFHTVDYFASQGIRLSQEVQPDDKLGKQLKSFTEWLKTMRRLPEATIEEVLDKPDYQIEQFAAHSLEEREVVTEAMAEVLLKQGKNEKASEIYHKLSLLNPHKSSYFAARIEELKHR